MADHDLRKTDTRLLAQMMQLGAESKPLWEPEELGEILRHQLSAPLDSDSPALDENLIGKLRSAEASGPPIQTFDDLLHHPRPPVELLEWTKQFAKTCRSHPDGPLPEEVASVLHILSVVAALVKCGRRITGLNDDGIRFTIGWALSLPWLDERTRGLLKEGRWALKPAT